MESYQANENDRAPAASIQLLNQYLASAVDLHALVKQAHWAVQGRGFVALTDIFGKVAVEIAFIASCIDDRAGGSGVCQSKFTHDGSVRLHGKAPNARGLIDGQHYVLAVHKALDVFGRSVAIATDRARDIHDDTTSKLFANISLVIKKQLWMVETQWLRNTPPPGELL